MADIGVLFVHGMGRQDVTFADGIQEALTERLVGASVDPARVAWQSGLWGTQLQELQDELWERQDLGALRWDGLRRFVVSALGDAAAYRPPAPGSDSYTERRHRSIYFEIHDAIRNHLVQLRGKLGGDKPLVVIAHSLGASVMSNYLWDVAHPNAGYPGSPPDHWTPFERGETLTALLTAGVSIPLFVFAYEEIIAIEFPPAALPDHLRPVATWLNFLDRDDVLGYPLKSLSPSYAQAVDADIEVNVGRAWESRTPVSHAAYWRDADFLDPVSDVLLTILRVV